MVDDELDPLIDDVAREMTSAPPRDGLARRVSVRIAGDDERRTWWRPWMLVPAASACALLLAVFVAREVRMPVKPIAMPGATAELPAPYVERAALQTQRFSAPVVSAFRRTEPPAPTLAPIEVDRLEIQPIVEMSAINIAPIAIDRIEISAMP